MDYRKVQPSRKGKEPLRRTPESRYWRQFRAPVLVKEYGAITGIEFSPVEPYDFAVTASTRVQIYNPHTNAPRKTISKFKNVAYSGSFRSDGKLIVAGGETAVVQVFDYATRTILRKFKGHDKAVRVTKFSSDNVHIYSAGDDWVSKVWDLAAEQEVATLRGHEDSIRCGVAVPASPDTWVTGSYDHTIRMWDARQAQATTVMNHGDPVEAVLVFSGGGLVASAGTNTIKIWDVLAGRLVHVASNHQKTVTCLSMDGTGSRVVSGSLDHQVKIYDVVDYSVTHSIKFSAPILSLGISRDNAHLAVGMADGTLCVRHRQPDSAEMAAEAADASDAADLPKLLRLGRGSGRAPIIHGGTYRYFMRGKNAKPADQDFQVETRRRIKLKSYDIFLKKFQYQKALNAALETRNPAIVISMFYELIHRDALRIAIGGRDPSTLEPLLSFLLKYLTHPSYSSILVDVCNVTLDIYSPVLGQTDSVDELFFRIEKKLREEIKFQKHLSELLGALDMIMAASFSGDADTAAASAASAGDPLSGAGTSGE